MWDPFWPKGKKTDSVPALTKKETDWEPFGITNVFRSRFDQRNGFGVRCDQKLDSDPHLTLAKKNYL